MKGLRGAVALLTRVPVGRIRPDDSVQSTGWFPLVGAAIGLIVWGVYFGASFIFPSTLAAAIAVVSGVGLTGGLHEDGLGDVADSFWGGWTPEQRMEILKDPRMGTYGTLALIASFLLRVFAIASFGRGSALTALVTAHAVSRTTTVVAIRWLKPASDGLAARQARASSSAQTAFGILTGLVIAAFALGWWSGLVLALAASATLLVGRLAIAKIGGITGDVLGALQQVTEVGILLVASAVLVKP